MKSCPPADSIGKRITPLAWLSFQNGLEVKEHSTEEAEEEINSALDPAIPKKCMGVKVVSH